MVSICLIINKITFNQILGKWFWDIYDPNDVNNSTGSIISLWGSHEIQMQLDVCKISKKMIIMGALISLYYAINTINREGKSMLLSIKTSNKL